MSKYQKKCDLFPPPRVSREPHSVSSPLLCLISLRLCCSFSQKSSVLIVHCSLHISIVHQGFRDAKRSSEFRFLRHWKRPSDKTEQRILVCILTTSYRWLSRRISLGRNVLKMLTPFMYHCNMRMFVCRLVVELHF